LLHRHYPASTLVRACPPPQVARPVPRGRPVGSHALPPPGVSRVVSDPLCRHAVAITPVGSLDQVVRNEGLSTPRYSPATAAFPVSVAGRLPHYPFRGLLSVHSRYGLPARGVAKRPFPSKAPTVSLPPPPLRLLPAGTTRVAGRELHPLRIDTFPRRTQKVGLRSLDSLFDRSLAWPTDLRTHNIPLTVPNRVQPDSFARIRGKPPSPRPKASAD
jgi:hypothetical protein